MQVVLPLFELSLLKFMVILRLFVALLSLHPLLLLAALVLPTFPVEVDSIWAGLLAMVELLEA